jgi:hypothetical protein
LSDFAPSRASPKSAQRFWGAGGDNSQARRFFPRWGRYEKDFLPNCKPVEKHFLQKIYKKPLIKSYNEREFVV